MTKRLIAIGDIHGCLDALNGLLDAIAPSADDTVVALGDYVDRGPDSKGVIDRLIELEKTCNLVALQGNHEEMMLDVISEKEPPFGWLKHGGVDTLDSYGFSGDMSVIPDSHRQFFDSMVDHFETDTHFFTHANYDPNLPLAETGIDLLRWVKLTQITPGPHANGKIGVVGHTHDRGGEIFDVGHLICLDTYCYGGGWLTAYDLLNNQFWQTNSEGELRK